LPVFFKALHTGTFFFFCSSFFPFVRCYVAVLSLHSQIIYTFLYWKFLNGKPSLLQRYDLSLIIQRPCSGNILTIAFLFSPFIQFSILFQFIFILGTGCEPTTRWRLTSCVSSLSKRGPFFVIIFIIFVICFTNISILLRKSKPSWSAAARKAKEPRTKFLL
jgi:hypothetical protein